MLPQGSVVATAGGRKLVEGIDLELSIRTFKLDPSLQASNTDQCFFRKQLFFGQQTRRFMG
jgi:hypothetical protein